MRPTASLLSPHRGVRGWRHIPVKAQRRSRHNGECDCPGTARLGTAEARRPRGSHGHLDDVRGGRARSVKWWVMWSRDERNCHHPSFAATDELAVQAALLRVNALAADAGAPEAPPPQTRSPTHASAGPPFLRQPQQQPTAMQRRPSETQIAPPPPSARAAWLASLREPRTPRLEGAPSDGAGGTAADDKPMTVESFVLKYGEGGTSPSGQRGGAAAPDEVASGPASPAPLGSPAGGGGTGDGSADTAAASAFRRYIHMMAQLPHAAAAAAATAGGGLSMLRNPLESRSGAPAPRKQPSRLLAPSRGTLRPGGADIRSAECLPSDATMSTRPTAAAALSGGGQQQQPAAQQQHVTRWTTRGASSRSGSWGAGPPPPSTTTPAGPLGLRSLPKQQLYFRPLHDAESVTVVLERRPGQEEGGGGASHHDAAAAAAPRANASAEGAWSPLGGGALIPMDLALLPPPRGGLPGGAAAPEAPLPSSDGVGSPTVSQAASPFLRAAAAGAAGGGTLQQPELLRQQRLRPGIARVRPGWEEEAPPPSSARLAPPRGAPSAKSGGESCWERLSSGRGRRGVSCKSAEAALRIAAVPAGSSGSQLLQPGSAAGAPAAYPGTMSSAVMQGGQRLELKLPKHGILTLAFPVQRFAYSRESC